MDPILAKKLTILERLKMKGQITEDVYEKSKSDVLNSLSDVPDRIESVGGYRKTIEATKPIAAELSDVVDKIKEKGGMVSKFGNTAKTIGRKALSVLPLVGAGAAAMGVGEKAMAGDFGGAAYDAADEVTDYIPGAAQLKMAVESPELGAGSDQINMPSEAKETNRRFKKIRQLME